MINPLDIIKEVEQGYFLPRGSIRSKKKGTALDEARSVAMALCRDNARFSYPELGLIFKRDHSTIISGVQKARRKSDLQEIYKKLSEICIQKYDNGL